MNTCAYYANYATELYKSQIVAHLLHRDGLFFFIFGLRPWFRWSCPPLPFRRYQLLPYLSSFFTSPSSSFLSSSVVSMALTSQHPLRLFDHDCLLDGTFCLHELHNSTPSSTQTETRSLAFQVPFLSFPWQTLPLPWCCTAR